VRQLEHSAVQQSYEDAREIVDILTAASADCRMSLDLRQRLSAVRERAERIARNTEVAGDRCVGHDARGMKETGDRHKERVRIPTIHLTEETGDRHVERVRIPTIHLNGTSGEVLHHQYATAIEALRRAMEAACDTRPNERDYYVQGADAGRTAQREHETRVASLRRVREELVSITEGIQGQLEARQGR
jgi:hypothetical protein